MGLLNRSRSSAVGTVYCEGASVVQAKSDARWELACEGDLVPAGRAGRWAFGIGRIEGVPVLRLELTDGRIQARCAPLLYCTLEASATPPQLTWPNSAAQRYGLRQ